MVVHGAFPDLARRQLMYVVSRSQPAELIQLLISLGRTMHRWRRVVGL